MPPDASGTLSSHAADIAAVIRYISKAPVLVGHSFGGLIAQRYAINAATGESGYPAVRALAFLASSSPEGVDYGRFIKRAPVMTAKVCFADNDPECMCRRVLAAEKGHALNEWFQRLPFQRPRHDCQGEPPAGSAHRTPT
jgi:pimeloyl-ACP methyl ester carboxylesterase